MKPKNRKKAHTDGSTLGTHRRLALLGVLRCGCPFAVFLSTSEAISACDSMSNSSTSARALRSFSIFLTA
jgi:hypothetical protein